MNNSIPSLIFVSVCAIFLLISLVKTARRKSAGFISITAVLTALSVVGRIVFTPLAGFKPCTAIIIIAGVSLGADAGFICGALTALISNIYFGQGMWTLFQMFSWGLIGVLSGILSSQLGKYKWNIYLFGAFSGVLYSFIMDVFSVIWQDGGFNLARFIAYAAGSAPFCAVYAFSNVVFLLILGPRMIRSIERVVLKYGLLKEN
ncbi:ECF transporter S component [Ruminococcus sp. 210702-SL.1.03]|uniref:ECF transporter S component n=1 Tax=Ruminococcus sp. 210702-SL.1.03 TaxID=2883233 RepID=UPI001D05C365|nr:ECF transporter S component [Ruminococcus sp. 210702-SL.1.03]MCB6616022.1 ECF transporter S component [Ruminococcus sp. 210702-SL.1.03]